MKGMINKGTLTALLAFQLVAVGVLLAARSGGVEEPEAFLAFDAEAVDAITVSNPEGTVTVAKVDDEDWQLPDGVPAASLKVESVIEKFADLSGSWPVANTGSSRERFEVTEDNHQRHVVLKAGEDTVADFYLGTSPGFRKTHARRADDGDVYAIGFSNYEAGVKTSDWLEKSLLRPTGSLEAIARPDGYELIKDEAGDWMAADGTELDQGKVQTFVGRFKGLSVMDVSDVALPETPTAVFGLTDDDGVLTFTVYALEDGEKYVATSDRVAGAYEIAKYIGEQLDKSLEDLAPDPPEEEAEEEAAELIESEPEEVAEPTVTDDTEPQSPGDDGT